MKNGKPRIQNFDMGELQIHDVGEEDNDVVSPTASFLYDDVYKSLAELSFLGIIIADKHGKIVSLNNSFENLTGIIQSDAIGLNMWDFLYFLTPNEYKTPEFLSILEKRYVKIINESAFWQRQVNEQKIATLNGGNISVEVSSFISTSPTGNLLVSALRDTSLQKLSERDMVLKHESLTKLGQFSVELAALPHGKNLESFITRQLKDFSGAIGVIYSEYNSETRTLTPKHIELESGLLEIIVNLLDHHVHKIHSVISDFMYHELTKSVFETGKSLNEVSLGVIPNSLSATAQALLKADRFTRIAYFVNGKLYGTSLLAMSKHQAYPPKDVFENFIFLTTAAIQRRYADTALMKSEEMLKSVTEDAADIIMKLDESGKIIYVNRVLPGYRKEDVIGRNFTEWTAPEYYDLMMQSLETVFTEGISQTYESRALGTNNEIRWYLSKLTPIFVDGEVENAVLILSDITKDKSEEVSVIESEEKFRIITQSSLDVIFIIDRFGKQLFFNKSVEKVLGYKADELTGRTFAEFLPEESVATYLTQLANIFLYKEISNFNTQMFHKDGYLVDVEINVRLVKLKGENVGLGSIRDITSRKRAEEQLKISIERNNALLGANPDLMFVFNSNCKIVDFHSEPHNQLLIDPDLFLGRLIDDILPHEVVVITHEKVKAVITSGEPDYATYELMIGGELKFFESRYVSCGNDQVLSIVRDITEQKHNEEAIRIAKESYFDIFNSVSDAIYIMDETGTFLDVNKGAETMYCQERQELIGKSITSVAVSERNNIDEINQSLRKVKETGSPEYFDLWAERRTGEIFPKEVIVSKGKYFGKDVLIATARDVTDKKQAEEKLKLKNEELINTNAEKDKFFSIMAHDLRSPLVSFLGITQILADDLPNLSMNDIQDLASGMKKSAGNLYGLLENLLEWSRLQRGITSFIPKTIRLKSKVNESLQGAMEASKTKGIEMDIQIPEDIEVYADENMLASTLRNLSSNAVKFSSKGGTINVEAKSVDNNFVVISVKDTGIGMSKEMMEKLFSLGEHKTNRSGTDGEPSSGLGLLLCKDFVEKNGGKLWMESEEGKGSTFYFSVPAKLLPE
ncbi:MAG: PAS domain S-box protein [Prolixibacteraceae bacterium]|jgi:PAS domain S-box-containing protein